jgi:hypothetical protein
VFQEYDENIVKYANRGCFIIILLLICFFTIMIVFGDFFVREENLDGVPTLSSTIHYGLIKTIFALLAGIVVLVICNTLVKLRSISKAKGVLLFAIFLLWIALNAALPLIFAIAYSNPINEIKELAVYYIPFILFFGISGIGLGRYRAWSRMAIFWIYPLFILHYINHNYTNLIGILWHVIIYSSLLFYLTRAKVKEQFN